MTQFALNFAAAGDWQEGQTPDLTPYHRGRLGVAESCWNPGIWYIQRDNHMSWMNRYSINSTHVSMSSQREWEFKHRWRSAWTLCEAIAFLEAILAGDRNWARVLLHAPEHEPWRASA